MQVAKQCQESLIFTLTPWFYGYEKFVLLAKLYFLKAQQQRYVQAAERESNYV